MTKEQKAAIARMNGAKSQGPKTAHGKAMSSKNALQHGLTAKNAIVLESESEEEFQIMLANYRAAYNPRSAVELDLVDQMVIARWRLHRLWTIEAALLDAEVVRRRPEVEKQFQKYDSAIELALAFKSLADESHSLTLTTHHEPRLFRMHHLAYHALRKLQNEPTQPSSNQPEPPQE